ncbi:hypothetical protein [Bradyrhizobium diazoefficiens]|uniref:hypothetical protein n=1 Tax=Bradyrhizobium diazoefficiens TaxID=1355477 RepID=UPI002714CB34|nr:hypothetical protein [Bradyrhizobium diazoefficiens]WLC19330.1 hypothetical protein QIH76_13735 [Bradyrhizobium diazoefficiens]
MALLSELVALCEACELDSGATLNVFARRLREAGRVSKAGRGRGAAHMTFLDAARFLIACAATDHPEQAADAELQFSNAVWSDGEVYETSDGGVQETTFHLDATSAPTLDVALAKVLEGIADGIVTLQREALIVYRGAVSAQLRTHEALYRFQHPTIAALVVAEGEALERLMDAVDHQTRRFRTGKNLIAQLEGALLRAVAYLIAGKKEESWGP